MSDQIRKTFQLGKGVYRKWRYPDREDYWYEYHHIRKITQQYVFAETIEGIPFRINRGKLERLGYDVHRTQGAVYYIELPDSYRKTTIGYLMDQEPRKVLRLPEEFTTQMVKDAYRIRALETHPDRGGNAEEFLQVQDAYEKLLAEPNLGQILKYIKENP